MTFEEVIAKLPKPYYRDEQADIVIYCADCLKGEGNELRYFGYTP
jgi:hypothetical protein